MAQTLQTTTKSKHYGNIPAGYHIGFFKITVADVRTSKTTGYMYITTPTPEHMELAIQNYITKYGILTIESITQEEYESNTQI